MKTIHNNGKFIYKFFSNPSKLPPNLPQVVQTKPWGLDEDEEEWYGDIHNLRDFIGYLRVNI